MLADLGPRLEEQRLLGPFGRGPRQVVESEVSYLENQTDSRLLAERYS